MYSYFVLTVDAARGIEFASDGSDHHIQQILDLKELPTLIDFLRSADYRLVQVGVKIMGNLVSGDDRLVSLCIALINIKLFINTQLQTVIILA